MRIIYRCHDSRWGALERFPSSRFLNSSHAIRLSGKPFVSSAPIFPMAVFCQPATLPTATLLAKTCLESVFAEPFVSHRMSPTTSGADSVIPICAQKRANVSERPQKTARGNARKC